MAARAIAGSVGICALAIGLAGCGRFLKKKADSGDAGAPTSESTAAQDQADQQLQDKIEEYVKCLNAISNPMYRARDRYNTFIKDSANGPTGKETFADVYRLPADATPSCSAGIIKAQAMPPPDPKLDATGSEYAAAAAAADTLMNQAESYFETKGFKADKWAKGKALHPQLMQAWTRFKAADQALHETLDGITKPLAQRTLARIEREDGRRFVWNRKHVLVTGRELMDATDPPAENPDIDLGQFNLFYTDFDKALDDLSTYASMHRPELADKALAPAWPAADANFALFTSKANDFKRAAKEYWRCLQDAPAKAKTPSGKIDRTKIGTCTDGSVALSRSEEAIRQYNDFIRISNERPFP